MKALVIYTGVLQYMEKKVDSVGAHHQKVGTVLQCTVWAHLEKVGKDWQC